MVKQMFEKVEIIKILNLISIQLGNHKNYILGNVGWKEIFIFNAPKLILH